MQVLLFSIVAICIAAINAQIADLPPPPGVLGPHPPPPPPTTSSTTTIVASKVDDDKSTEEDDDDKKPHDHKHKPHHEHDDDKKPYDHKHKPHHEHDDDKKPYDHKHKFHHEHNATVSIDVHNILDIFTHELRASEKRIVGAIQHKRLSKPATAPKSYRTADRLNEKEN